MWIIDMRKVTPNARRYLRNGERRYHESLRAVSYEPELTESSLATMSLERVVDGDRASAFVGRKMLSTGSLEPNRKSPVTVERVRVPDYVLAEDGRDWPSRSDVRRRRS